jgi:metal-responsive CopG/Arc/MetJ family transcriptional regulator
MPAHRKERTSDYLVSARLPSDLVALLDVKAEHLEITRSELIRRIASDAVAPTERKKVQV